MQRYCNTTCNVSALQDAISHIHLESYSGLTTCLSAVPSSWDGMVIHERLRSLNAAVCCPFGWQISKSKTISNSDFRRTISGAQCRSNPRNPSLYWPSAAPKFLSWTPSCKQAAGGECCCHGASGMGELSLVHAGFASLVHAGFVSLVHAGFVSLVNAGKCVLRCSQFLLFSGNFMTLPRDIRRQLSLCTD